MSRRASFFARQTRKKVRFPDDVIFDSCVKESDPECVAAMLRRVSAEIDVNRINQAGMTALHQAVLDDNMAIVQVLIGHGAKVNIADVDTWTPLHAAAANGFTDIVKFLLKSGADKGILTEDGETALDLVDDEDTEIIALLRDNIEESGKKPLASSSSKPKSEPAWVRKISAQEEILKRDREKSKENSKDLHSKSDILKETSFIELKNSVASTTSNKERLL